MLQITLAKSWSSASAHILAKIVDVALASSAIHGALHGARAPLMSNNLIMAAIWNRAGHNVRCVNAHICKMDVVYQSLLSAGLPVIIVDILCNWYSKLFFAVRWDGELFAYFAVGSGVRQGGCLSPAIFNGFMNLFIIQLKLQGIGCHVLHCF